MQAESCHLGDGRGRGREAGPGRIDSQKHWPGAQEGGLVWMSGFHGVAGLCLEISVKGQLAS